MLLDPPYFLRGEDLCVESEQVVNSLELGFSRAPIHDTEEHFAASVLLVEAEK